MDRDLAVDRKKWPWADLVTSKVLLALGLLCVAAVFEPTAATKAQVLVTVGHLPDILTRVPRNFANVWIPLAVLLSTWWPGRRLLAFARVRATDAAAQLCLSIVLGFAVWMLVCTTLAIMGVLYAPILWSVLIAFLALGLIEAARSFPASIRFRFDIPSAIIIAWAAFIAWIALLGALEPEVQFDGRHYHLADALRYAQHHGTFNMVASEHFIYGGFSNYLELFCAALIVMGGVGAAKVLAWSLGVLSFAAIFAVATEVFGSRRGGLLGACAFLSTPIVTWAMTTESTDLAQVPFAMVVLWLIYRWATTGRPLRLIALAGALCGVTIGMKAFGLEFAFCIVCLVAYICFATKRDALKIVSVFVGAMLVAASGWLGQAYAYTGDPVFPIAMSLFHTPFSFPATVMGLQAPSPYGANGHFNGIFLSPISFTYDIAEYRNIIGPLYLVTLPIILFKLFVDKFRNRTYLAGAGLAIAGLVLIYAFGTVEIRYLSWGLAIVAALTGVAIANLIGDNRTRLTGIAAAIVYCTAIVASNQLSLPLYRYASLPYAEGAEYLNWAYLYENEPEADIQLASVPMIVYMNAHLHATDKVFDGAGQMIFNCYSDIELYNGSDFANPASQGEWSLVSPNAYDDLRANTIDYVVIFRENIATLRATPLWHHLRYVDRMPRSPFYASSAKDTVLYKIVD